MGMRASRRLLLVAATVGLASCGASAAAGASSGIAGTVLIGPTCPVQRPGEACSRPYATTLLLVSAAHRRIIARVRSSSNGHFRISLGAGRYILRGSRSGPPWLRSLYVTVPRSRYAYLTVRFDSGIR